LRKPKTIMKNRYEFTIFILSFIVTSHNLFFQLYFLLLTKENLIKKKKRLKSIHFQHLFV